MYYFLAFEFTFLAVCIFIGVSMRSMIRNAEESWKISMRNFHGQIDRANAQAEFYKNALTQSKVEEALTTEIAIASVNLIREMNATGKISKKTIDDLERLSEIYAKQQEKSAQKALKLV